MAQVTQALSAVTVGQIPIDNEWGVRNYAAFDDDTKELGSEDRRAPISNNSFSNGPNGMPFANEAHVFHYRVWIVVV
ncbi:hypothetical protein JTE90_020263 [Oedothorax gibbosus]|uniref:Uncharacterized protein n=1 Tax=Oedothorax gibbosus TaxID=931172 RepID=A0AAV6VQ85_9ARAC|nr:hypothetical protein JTE90_020263 [Oedothorax gibbosus]